MRTWVKMVGVIALAAVIAGATLFAQGAPLYLGTGDNRAVHIGSDGVKRIAVLPTGEVQFFTGTSGTANAYVNTSGVWTGSISGTVDGDLLLGAAKYVNWGTTTGESGYGLRITAGHLQYKNSGGSWTDMDQSVSGNYWSRTGTVLSPTTAGDSLGFSLLAGTDATYDIGASGANRFRDVFMSRNATVGGTLTVSGNSFKFGQTVGSIWFSGNDIIGQPEYDGVGGLSLNYNGYNGGTTRSRNTTIYDGLHETVAAFIGGDKSTTLYGTITARGSGPHAIGGAANSILGLNLIPTATGGANGNAVGVYVEPTVVKGTGTHALVIGTSLQPPTISAGGGATITNSATAYISAAPTGATNNYALWVAAGASKFGGAVTMGSTLDVTGAASAASLATAQSAPTAEGTFKVYCSGSSPSRVCKIAIYDGGAERVVGTMTY